MLRFDSGTKFKILEDANGFITAEGVIATAGEKLRYGQTEETIAESALFENMDEWEGLPLTLQHPKSFVTPDNAQKHQVGTVVSVRRDGDSLIAKFKITSRKAIDAVKSGLKGLSAGYKVAMDGLTQVARENNHLALCNVGRSPSSGIRRDSYNSDGAEMQTIKINGKEIKLDCSDAEAQLLQNEINGVEETRNDAQDAFNQLVDGIQSIKLDEKEEKIEVKEKIEKIKADMIKYKSDKKKMSELQGQLDALKESGKSKMDSADVENLLSTYDICKKADSKFAIKNDSGEFKTQSEMLVEALKSVSPDIKLDGKEENIDYLQARLDAVIDFKNISKSRGNPDGGKKHDGLSAQERADAKFFSSSTEGAE